MGHRRRPKSNGTKYRNKTVSWRQDDDELLQWMYSEYWHTPLKYNSHSRPKAPGTVGPSPFVHAAIGMFARFLIWCKDNGVELSEEYFRAWIGNPEATSDIWKIKERVDKTKTNPERAGAIGVPASSPDNGQSEGNGVLGTSNEQQPENASPAEELAGHYSGAS